MNQKICRYNKYGYCKYADKCRFRHNNVICVKNNCNVFDCEMRHPVVCKHFMNFRKCKFTDCAYKHIKGSDNDDMAMKIKNVEAKITEVKKANNVRDIEEKLIVFERKYEGKTEAMEKQYAAKIEKLEKKYASKIEDLDRKYIGKIEELENKLENTINTFERLLEKPKHDNIVIRKKCGSH